MLSEAKRRANSRYHSKCTTRTIRFNPEKEQDLIDYIETIPNFAGFVKEALRKEIQDKKHKKTCTKE